MKILFFHGGPGLNSNPENKLLMERFAKYGMELICWNEPSSLRPQNSQAFEGNAYDAFLASAERFFLEHYNGEPLILMAHSFGAHPACFLAKKYPEKLAKIIFISTDIVLSVTDRNMFTFTMLDFKERADARHLELQKVLDRYTGNFDQNAEDGFGLLVQNPYWFDYYWFNKERKKVFDVHYQEPGYTIDAGAFFNVRRSFSDLEMNQSKVPAIAVFGRHDIVVSRDVELSVLNKRFKTITVFDFELSAHYPHIEQSDEFMSLLAQELSTRKHPHAKQPNRELSL